MGNGGFVRVRFLSWDFGNLSWVLGGGWGVSVMVCLGVRYHLDLRLEKSK